MKNPHTHWALSPVGILVIAALLRIAFLLTKKDQPAFGDTAEYEAMALQMLGLADSTGSPRAPAYPALMAVGYKFWGVHNYTAVRWLQIPISLGIVELVRRIGEHVGGRKVGVMSAWLTALAPTLIFTSSMLYPTALYTLCVVGITLAALQLDSNPRPLTAVQLGLWSALGFLTDTVVFAPLAALALWFAWRSRGKFPVLLRTAGVFAATVLLVVLPIKSVGRTPGGKDQVFVAKSQYVLHYARTDSSVSQNRWIQLPPGESGSPMPLKAFAGHELALLQSQTIAYVHDVVFEFLHFFAPMPDRIQSKNEYNKPWVLWIGAIYFTPVLLFSLLGLARGSAPGAQRLALALVVLATAGFYSLFFSQTRYRIPVEPQILILTAMGVLSLLRTTGASRPGDPQR